MMRTRCALSIWSGARVPPAMPPFPAEVLIVLVAKFGYALRRAPSRSELSRRWHRAIWPACRDVWRETQILRRPNMKNLLLRGQL